MNRQRATPGSMTPNMMARFCGGRARFNAQRRIAAERRRLDLVKQLRYIDIREVGWRAMLAKKLEVSRWTIRRDLLAIRQSSRDRHVANVDREFAQRAKFANKLERSIAPDPLHQEVSIRIRKQRKTKP